MQQVHSRPRGPPTPELSEHLAASVPQHGRGVQELGQFHMPQPFQRAASTYANSPSLFSCEWNKPQHADDFHHLPDKVRCLVTPAVFFFFRNYFFFPLKTLFFREGHRASVCALQGSAPSVCTALLSSEAHRLSHWGGLSAVGRLKEEPMAPSRHRRAAFHQGRSPTCWMLWGLQH